MGQYDSERTRVTQIHSGAKAEEPARPGEACVVVIYGPVLISALANPSTEIKIEGINYFFDTLLFAGVILALASATPPTD